MIINASAGGVEYASALITEVTSKDITTATFQVGLSTQIDTGPTQWQAPDVIENVGTNVRVKLLVQGQPSGTYWLWVKVMDTPEIIPIACTNQTIIIV